MVSYLPDELVDELAMNALDFLDDGHLLRVALLHLAPVQARPLVVVRRLLQVLVNQLRASKV